jgi:hypothetical protein
VENGMAVFTWSTSSPPLLSWYRMEWSFAPPAG